MRSLHVVALVAGLALLTPHLLAAPDSDRQATGTGSGSGAGSGSGSGASSTTTVTTDKGATYTVTQKPKAEQPKAEQPEPAPGRWVRALTNVQVELTISDQTGSSTPEKKTVTMIVSSGSWGRIRSAGNVKPGPDAPPAVVELNVDARPFVAVDGPIQMELTLVYRPLGAATDDLARSRPLPLNQSLTVILQSGKSLVVSQAADPLNDRKIGVEVKATVLK